MDPDTYKLGDVRLRASSATGAVWLDEVGNITTTYLSNGTVHVCQPWPGTYYPTADFSLFGRIVTC